MCSILHRDCTEIQGCANYCDSRLSIKSCQGLFHRVVLAKKQLQSDPLEADFDFTFRILQSTSVFERILENPSIFGGILKKPQDFAKYLRIRKNFAKSLRFGRNFEKTSGFCKIPPYSEEFCKIPPYSEEFWKNRRILQNTSVFWKSLRIFKIPPKIPTRWIASKCFGQSLFQILELWPYP